MANILFTQSAEKDLDQIEYYIAVELENVEASDRIIDGILDKIDELIPFPTMHPFVNDPLARSLGFRMIRFESYNVFYRYDDKLDTIYIVRILYEGANWQYILTSLNW